MTENSKTEKHNRDKLQIPRLPKPDRDRLNMTASRYDFEATADFLSRVSRVGSASRRKTETEKRVGRIAYSIENDFRPGFSGRPHGDDAQSIALKQIDWLLPRIEKERTEAQIEQLRKEVEAGRLWLAHKERLLASLDHSRGSAEFRKRQREIDLAWQRVGA